jgi:hypothetical protein
MKNVGTRSSSTCKEMVLLTQTFSFNDFHDLQLPTNLFDQAPFFFARHNRSHFPTRVFTYLLKRHTRSLSPRHLFPLEGWLLYSLVSFLYFLESIVMMDSPPPSPLLIITRTVEQRRHDQVSAWIGYSLFFLFFGSLFELVNHQTIYTIGAAARNLLTY